MLQMRAQEPQILLHHMITCPSKDHEDFHRSIELDHQMYVRRWPIQ